MAAIYRQTSAGTEQGQKRRDKNTRFSCIAWTVERKNAGEHTSHRDVGVGMARCMIGLSLGLNSFLGRQRLDKFYQLSAHDAVSKAFWSDIVNPGGGVRVPRARFFSVWTRRNARKRHNTPRCLFMKRFRPPRLDRLRARARTNLDFSLPTRPFQVSFPSAVMARGIPKRAPRRCASTKARKHVCKS